MPYSIYPLKFILLLKQKQQPPYFLLILHIEINQNIKKFKMSEDSKKQGLHQQSKELSNKAEENQQNKSSQKFSASHNQVFFNQDYKQQNFDQSHKYLIETTDQQAAMEAKISEIEAKLDLHIQNTSNINKELNERLSRIMKDNRDEHFQTLITKSDKKHEQQKQSIEKLMKASDEHFQKMINFRAKYQTRQLVISQDRVIDKLNQEKWNRLPLYFILCLNTQKQFKYDL